MRREVAFRDPNASEQTRQAVLADEDDPKQVGSSIPGMVSKVNVQPGDKVEENQVLLIIEAMKIMNEIKAPCDGKIIRIMAQPGDMVEYNQVLCVIE